jgi:ribosome modulation factor
MPQRRYESAEYWLGWQAVQTRQQTCPFTDIAQRNQWARGFQDAVEEGRTGKAWYKSRTLLIGLGLFVFGIGIAVYGLLTNDADGPTYAAVGGTLTASSVLQLSLRLITQQQVYFGSSAGCGSSFNNSYPISN